MKENKTQKQTRRQKTEAAENIAWEQAQLQEHKNTGDSGDRMKTNQQRVKETIQT